MALKRSSVRFRLAPPRNCLILEHFLSSGICPTCPGDRPWALVESAPKAVYLGVRRRHWRTVSRRLHSFSVAVGSRDRFDSDLGRADRPREHMRRRVIKEIRHIRESGSRSLRDRYWAFVV